MQCHQIESPVRSYLSTSSSTKEGQDGSAYLKCKKENDNQKKEKKDALYETKIRSTSTKRARAEKEQLPITEVFQTPHTLRLLKLIEESSDQQQVSMAISHLMQIMRITAQKSAAILWDVLGRLSDFLFSSEWTTRINAALAIENIAQIIPIQDQHNFLSLNADSLNKMTNHMNNPVPASTNSRDGIFLRLDQHLNVETLKIILSKGRLLLSHKEPMLKNDYHDEEEEQLKQFDNQMVNTNQDSCNQDTFSVQQRIRLQRRILAQRLGLARLIDVAGSKKEFINDVIGSAEDICQFQERRRKKQRRKAVSSSSSHKKKTSENSNSNIRALLVLESYRSTTTTRNNDHCNATSHQNPQQLLATELIYRLFDPCWFIRHGALLGILALLRGFKNSTFKNITTRGNPTMKTKNVNSDDDGSNFGNDEEKCSYFGSWPQDILCKCICLLVLDRFGDYSSTLWVPGFSTCKTSTTRNMSSNSVVAPVRENAGQLVSILMLWATPEIKEICLERLFWILKENENEQNESDGEEDDDYINKKNNQSDWEIKHGILVTIKYFIVALNENNINKKENSDIPNGNALWCNLWIQKTIQLSTYYLNDNSDDVKSVAAQILTHCYSIDVIKQQQLELEMQAKLRLPTRNMRGGNNTTSNKPISDSNHNDKDEFALQVFPQLWKVLTSLTSRDKILLSSCLLDLVHLFALILQNHCSLILEKSVCTTSTTSITCHPTSTTFCNIENVILILGNFIHHDFVASIKISALQALSTIIEPISQAFISSDCKDENSNDSFKKMVGYSNTNENSMISTLNAFCQIIDKLFDSYFIDHCHCDHNSDEYATGNSSTKKQRKCENDHDYNDSSQFCEMRETTWEICINSFSKVFYEIQNKKPVSGHVGEENNKKLSKEDIINCTNKSEIIVFNLQVSLLMKYFGLNYDSKSDIIIDTKNIDRNSQNCRKMYTLWSSSSLQLENLFESQLVSSHILGKFFRVISNSNTNRAKAKSCNQFDKERPYRAEFHKILEFVLLFFWESPWTQQCEASCFLYFSLTKEVGSSNDSVSYHNITGNPFIKILSRFQEQLGEILYSENRVPICLEIEYYRKQQNGVLKVDSHIYKELEILFDQLVISGIQMIKKNNSSENGSIVSSTSPSEEGCKTAKLIIDLWKSFLKSKGILITGGKENISNTAFSSMRTLATISGTYMMTYATTINTSSSFSISALSPSTENDSEFLFLLPNVVTPIVRPIMTSLKNEIPKNYCNGSSLRLSQSCTYMVDLLQRLRTPLSLTKKGESKCQIECAHLRAHNKILNTMCKTISNSTTKTGSNFDIEYINDDNALENAPLPDFIAFSRVVQMLIKKLSLKKCFTSLNYIQPIWMRLQPLLYIKDSSHHFEIMNTGTSMVCNNDKKNEILRALNLLRVIVKSGSRNRGEESSYHCDNNPQQLPRHHPISIQIITMFLPCLLHLACDVNVNKISACQLNSESAIIRKTVDVSFQNQIASIVHELCMINSELTLATSLPILIAYLNDNKNVSCRYVSLQLLQTIIRKVGVQICDHIRQLLPIVMALMADSYLQCSKIANKIFAILVQMAPLVKVSSRNKYIGCAKTTSTRHSNDCNRKSNHAEEVIDHLILGKSLPPLEMPKQISNVLQKNGVSLRQYQMEGVAWLRFLQTVNLNGALCDSMGLGKTLQALLGVAICHYYFQHHSNNENQCENMDKSQSNQTPSNVKVMKKPATAKYTEPVSLVVCPSSVIGHWEAEIEKYFGSSRNRDNEDESRSLDSSLFRCLCVTGNVTARKHLWREEIRNKNIVITSYAILRSDISYIEEQSWQVCILDEGHLLKNPKTATARASRKICANHKLILTGTPVQNKVEELWAAFDFLMPNFLGTSKSFKKEFAAPIRRSYVTGASSGQICLGMEKLQELHQQVLPFILRREKEQVLKELPPKIITIVPCIMSEEQRILYAGFCSSAQSKRAIAALHNAADGVTKSNFAGDNGKELCADALKSLLFLRLLCTHPLLVYTSNQLKQNKVLQSALPSSNYNTIELSGKLLAIHELLRNAGIHKDYITGADHDSSIFYCGHDDDGGETDNSATDPFANVLNPDEELSTPVINSLLTNEEKSSSKCLIFSQFTQSLDVTEKLLLRSRMPSLHYLRLDGNVPVKDRSSLVDKFNNDPSVKVMLLTTKVGGLGLNLTGADTVIFLENSYNPFVDLQAMDRAHRIGQNKTVNVYKLVTKNSIEEKILLIQEKKMKMSNAIVNADNSTMFSMGTDKLLDIFTCRSNNNDSNSSSSDKESLNGENHQYYNLDALVEHYKEDYNIFSMDEFVKSFRE